MADGAMRRERILLDTPALLVREIAHGTPRCIVTFSHYEADPAAPRLGFAEHFLDSRGIDAIHVISRANDWFQHPDMHRAIAPIRAALGGRHCITYGSSMGAYAAIRFAGAIGAARALALSPQYSIDRAVVPFERRWQAESRTVRFLPWPEVADPPEALILFDPGDEDARHAALWAAERRVVPVAVPHASHPVSAFLGQAGLLPDLPFAVLEDRFDPAAFRRAMRLSRARSAEYHATLADRQPPCRAAWSVSMMQRAARIAPENWDIASRLAILLYQAGLWVAAEAAHRRALALAPGQAVLQFRYGVFLQRLGRHRQALAALEAACSLEPASAGLHRHRRHLRLLVHAPWPVRLPLRLANALVAPMDRLCWGRRRRAFGRLVNPPRR